VAGRMFTRNDPVRLFKVAQPAIFGCFAILGSNRGSTKAGKTGGCCLSPSEGILCTAMSCFLDGPARVCEKCVL
jgi:hypothetical protein